LPVSASPSTSGSAWYVGGNEPAKSNNRLLLVSYAFPPDIAVGALRWRKFARYAAERKWAFDVIALDPGELTKSDPAGLSDLPPGTRALGVPHPVHPLIRLHRVLLATRRRLRSRRGAVAASDTTASDQGEAATAPPRSRIFQSYLAILDYAHYRLWARRAARATVRVFDPKLHRVIVTSGPPHMAHEAGRLASIATGLPLVLDLRDPWTMVEGMQFEGAGSAWLRLSQRYERRTFAHAALIVANTQEARAAMIEAYPAYADRIIAVTNGFDEEEVIPVRDLGRRFLLAFAGNIYFDRSPRALFEGVAKFVKQLGLTPEQFGIELMGNVSHFGGVPLTELARDVGIDGFLTVHGPRPRREAREFLASAAMLFSVPLGTRLTVPAKVYEYVQYSAWILALSDPGSATAQILRGTTADVVSPSDIDGIAATLRTRYEQFQRGERPMPLTSHRRLSRRAQANAMFDALDALVGPERPASDARSQSALADRAEA
jgi:glycosyltransferase involved in cell wall biosynthesis